MASNQATLVASEDGELLPASPTSEYISSSVLSLSILAVFESEIPINYLQTLRSLRDEFLSITPRFSSILLTDVNGIQWWKRVEIRLEDHVHSPHFPPGLQPDTYDEYFREYLSKIGMENLPANRPLWELHLFKYPTTAAAGTIVFKLHHALGDGYSLMGALFSCLKRAEDPSLPLTFPSTTMKEERRRPISVKRLCQSLSQAVSACWNTTYDFTRSVLQSTVWEDGRNAVRSGTAGVEFQPISVSTTTLSLDDIRRIKSTIGGSVNDVVVGIVFSAIQKYKQRMCRQNHRTSRMTALVLLNTRMVGGYESVPDMLRAKTWGNNFTFLHIPIPSSKQADADADADPLVFISKAKKTIKRQRHSLVVYLTAKLLQALRILRGPKEVSRYIYKTLKNTSIAITNMIGPVEKMEMGSHPIKSFYFVVVGSPQSLSVTVVSYMGDLRITVVGEEGFIDSQLLSSCVREAFDSIYAAVCGDTSIGSN